MGVRPARAMPRKEGVWILRLSLFRITGTAETAVSR
jgi:hypothetical protein